MPRRPLTTALTLTAAALTLNGPTFTGLAQSAQRQSSQAQPAPGQSAQGQPAPAPAKPRGARPASALADRLRGLKAEADSLATQQRTLLVDLRRLDVDRQLKATQLEETRDTLAGLDASQRETSQRLARTEAALEAAKPAIRERLVRIYKLGRLGYTRLLLDVDDARTFQQTARVVSLMARRDRAEIDRHARLLSALRAERARLTAERKTAEELQGQLAREDQALAQAIAAHGARVKEVAERRDLNAQLVAELTAAQDRLSRSVSQFASTPAAGSVNPAGQAGLGGGRFDWPVTGLIATRFGRQQANRFGTEITRNGIDITTEAGTPVKVVDDGKVAFADVFSGFGQLVIVDHGQKTYSLYGHLSAMAVQRGEAVVRGQVVGSSGTSPTGTPAVYFELRIDGKPVDPVQWLKRQGG